MRVNLPSSEDQPPRKIPRQNSRTIQNEEQGTPEAVQEPHNYASTSGLQSHQTLARDTTLTTPQLPQAQQAEAMEHDLNDDNNIPELFKTIANKKV